MTPDTPALKALDIFEGCTIRKLAQFQPTTTNTPPRYEYTVTLREDFYELIRTALARSAKVDEVIRELEFIKVVSSVNVRSAYDNDMSMHKLCTIRIHAERALKQFSGEEK